MNRQDARFLTGVLLVFLLFGAPLQAEEGEHFAFLVGVRKYPATIFTELPGAENDVTRLAETLRNRGVKKENLVLLTHSTGADDPRFAPTAANVKRELNLLLENRNENDIVTIALAGHGIEPPGKPYFFLPQDADLADPRTLVSIDDIYAELKTCKAKLKLLFVDACREDPLAPAARSSVKPNLVPQSVTMPRLADPPGGTAAFFSCSRGQLARERADRVDGKVVHHGVFFRVLIEAFEGKAEDSSGEITVPDLEKYVKKEVETYVRTTLGTKQYPDVRNQTVGLVPLFREAKKSFTNLIGMKFNLIPAGSFMMGSPEGEKERSDEENQVEVTLTKSFYMGVYEVTQGEYEKLMGTNPSWFCSSGDGKDQVAGLDTSRFPVEKVSWDDAVKFCEALTKKEGARYRLPTEAEWEYACRAGTSTPFFFGDRLNGTEANCNGTSPYGTTTKGKYLDRTITVGSYGANRFGLYDLHGNVWEWCSDGYEKTLPGGRDPFVSAGFSRVIRGGGWGNNAAYCRSAYRSVSTPSRRYSSNGFRVVCER